MALRGFTTTEQDARFGNKQKALLRSMKFPAEFDKKARIMHFLRLRRTRVRRPLQPARRVRSASPAADPRRAPLPSAAQHQAQVAP